MTDRELIQALRDCRFWTCSECKWQANCRSGEVSDENAADRLEALLSEVEKLEERNNSHELFEDALQSAIDALIVKNTKLTQKMGRRCARKSNRLGGVK